MADPNLSSFIWSVADLLDKIAQKVQQGQAPKLHADCTHDLGAAQARSPGIPDSPTVGDIQSVSRLQHPPQSTKRTATGTSPRPI